MKTTLEIPDELFRRAKEVALQRGTSLKAVVTQALEKELGSEVAERPPILTHVFPPYGTVTQLQDDDAVLKAIRELRDGVSAAQHGGLDGGTESGTENSS
jgi:hypothetical protein